MSNSHPVPPVLQGDTLNTPKSGGCVYAIFFIIHTGGSISNSHFLGDCDIYRFYRASEYAPLVLLNLTVSLWKGYSLVPPLDVQY